jgi:acyl carrier protein
LYSFAQGRCRKTAKIREGYFGIPRATAKTHMSDRTGPLVDQHTLSREQLREKVLACLAEAAEVRGMKADSALRDDSVLLESGLDSLGFAVLVVRLEETLGYDPFVLMSEPVYPKTFGEFLDIYERCQPRENLTAC